MTISDHLVKKANKLFLHFTDKMQLEFCGQTHSYHLKNPKLNKCHPLELLLISDQRFTGNKIVDIRSLLKKSYRWILGFHHGYTKKQIKYKRSEYLEGYNEGRQAGMQNKDNG